MKTLWVYSMAMKNGAMFRNVYGVTFAESECEALGIVMRAEEVAGLMAVGWTVAALNVAPIEQRLLDKVRCEQCREQQEEK